ncbi:MAG: hypothetical protein ACE5DN_02585, partial [Flavobacteriales bacterium]
KLTDGTQGYGKVLTSDATGNASWKEKRVAFNAYIGTSQTFPLNTYVKVNFNGLTFDDGSNFNTTTDEFTAPVSGVYHFDLAFSITDMPGQSRLVLSIKDTGGNILARTVVTNDGASTGANQYESAVLSADLRLTAGTVIYVEGIQVVSGPSTIYGSGTNYSFFCGHLVYED